MVLDKTALITGVTGQDGAYLSRLLLEQGYTVHGIKRRSSSFNTSRIDEIFVDRHLSESNFHLHFGDVTDGSNLTSLITDIKPQFLFNLAAQSHVKVSFETPEYTANSDALGVLRILEGIRLTGLNHYTRFYQASTSEIFGNSDTKYQSEETPFRPRSPYGVAKLYGYWITKNYRDAYGIHASNGILFNHESPLRGETFVTQKIARAVARISKGENYCLYLGNLDAARDWGHAREYVKAMLKIVLEDKPDDYVIATGRAETVRKFVELAFEVVDIEIDWRGDGLDELGINSATGETLVKIDPSYYRPTEIDYLRGDAGKAARILNWKPQSTLEDLVQEMVLAAVEGTV